MANIDQSYMLCDRMAESSVKSGAVYESSESLLSNARHAMGNKGAPALEKRPGVDFFFKAAFGWTN